MNFLEFVANKKQLNESKVMLTEAFKKKDVNKSLDLILKLFKKNINGIVVMDKNGYEVTTGGKKCIAYQFLQVKDKKMECMWTFNYLIEGESAEVYSIDFFDGSRIDDFLMNPKGAKTNVSIFTMGSSIVYFLPMIYHIVNEKDYSLTEKEAKTLAKKVTESQAYSYYIGAVEYVVLEGISDNKITDTFKMVTEMDKELSAHRWAKRDERDAARKNRKNDPEAYEKINAEYNEILNAIRGGANTMEELRLAMKKNVGVSYNSPSIEQAEEELKKEKEDPEVSFKKMNIYIKSVLKGMQPGVIICGAPGIGKTYRVKRQLKAAGYNEGHNLYTIKGTESPRQLYIDMYEYKDKGNIIVIDDADALVGAKAPEVAINILKAALDSTKDDEGRLVSYKVTGDLKDEEGIPIPKRMYFNAGVIVLTNYSVGQLDTALRGRVFTQTLDFDVEQILDIIKGIMPEIEKATISSTSKMKALEHLQNLNKQGTKMVISIRSFVAAARLFELTADEDLTEDQVKEMIKEQMQNQAMSGGKHF